MNENKWRKITDSFCEKRKRFYKILQMLQAINYNRKVVLGIIHCMRLPKK